MSRELATVVVMSKPKSLRERLSYEVQHAPEISPGIRGYFAQRLRGRMYSLVLARFAAARERGLTKAELARRIGKRPEVVGRLLGSPGNWTIDTVSDLLLGIGGEELIPSSAAVDFTPKANSSPAAILDAGAEWAFSKQSEAAERQKQPGSAVSGSLLNSGHASNPTFDGFSNAARQNSLRAGDHPLLAHR